MTEVQAQAAKPLDQEAGDLAGQRFEQLAQVFTEGLRGVSPEAAEQAQKVLEAIKDKFTSAVAKEIKGLRTAGDETSLRTALDKVTQLRISLSGVEAVTQTEVTADTILQGFKKLDDGVIELTLPKELEKLAQERGTTAIQLAGEILNAAATTPVEEGGKGMKYPVFYEGYTDWWATNEVNTDLQTEPGRTYQFKIPTDSVLKTRSEQVRDHGEGAPLGAIAIAEACERLNTENNGTLFKDADGNKVWVRGSAPGVALYSPVLHGVSVHDNNDDKSVIYVAFAPSVPARN